MYASKMFLQKTNKGYKSAMTTVLAFARNILPGDILPEKGESMTYPKGERVDHGIELIARNPHRYKVTVSRNKGREKLCGSVVGTINDARDLQYKLRRQLEERSLKSQEKFTNIWGALVYYVVVEYCKTAQYIEGSGAAKVRYWLLRIGNKAIKDLCSSDINEAILDLRSRGLRESAIIPYVSFLKTALKRIRQIKKTEIPKGIFEDIEEVKAAPVEKFYIDQSDIDRIVSRLPPWSIPFTTFKRIVPSRLEELYDAKASDIDLRSWMLFLSDTKAGVGRWVPIPEGQRRYFRYAKNCGSKWAFFRIEVRANGEKVFCQLSRNHLSKLFSRARDALGLNSSLCLRHLRHESIRNYREAGVSVETIAGIAGNTPETIHRHYDYISVQAQKEAVEKAAERLKTRRPQNVVPMRRVAGE